MNALIPIQSRELAGTEVQTVDARELHAFLEVKSEFRNWIKNRIDDFGFVEGQDFATTVEIYRGGERKDYHLALDMGKELSMVERNVKGKEARAYFIECERQAKAAPQHMIPQTLPEALRLAANLADERNKLQLVVAEQAPKVAVLELLTEAEGCLTLTNAGKVFGLERDVFIRWLHRIEWIYRNPRNEWTAHAAKERPGYVRVKMTPFINSKTGETEYSHSVKVTPKGMAKLGSMIEAGEGPLRAAA